MKLAKRISKGIALCAVLTIISVLGGVLTSCSNGSEDSDPIENPETPPVEDPAKTITFTVTENSTNAEETSLIFKYDRSAAGAKELVTIEKCGIIVKLNGTAIKTIDKLEFALDEYGAYFEGEKSETTRKEYKAKVSIGKQVKKGDKVVVYYNEGVGTITGEGKDADAIKSLIVSLVDTDEAVKYYKELADNKNEYQPLFPAEDEEDESGKDPVESGKDPVESGKDPVESDKDPVEPKEEVIYKLDFSGAKAPENYSMSEDFFKPNEGVQMTGAWKEFSISPKDIGGKDLKSANYIKVSFKCSADAAFSEGDKDNNRFMVGAFKNAEIDGNWKDTNTSWTCFFDKDTDGDIPAEVKTVEKEINWEQKADAEGNKLPLVVLSDISGFKIYDCNFAKGTLTVQSIEFIKK